MFCRLLPFSSLLLFSQNLRKNLGKSVLVGIIHFAKWTSWFHNKKNQSISIQHCFCTVSHSGSGASFELWGTKIVSCTIGPSYLQQLYYFFFQWIQIFIHTGVWLFIKCSNWYQFSILSSDFVWVPLSQGTITHNIVGSRGTSCILKYTCIF